MWGYRLTTGASGKSAEQTGIDRRQGDFLVPQQALVIRTEANSEVVRYPALKGRYKRKAPK